MLVPIALFAAAISDPLHWLNALGITTGNPDWIYPPIWRQSVCFTVCLLWLLVWYHRQRVTFEDRQQDPTMPLYLVCRWIARDSVWAAKYDEARDGEWASRVDVELMGKVMQSRIELFGKRHECGNPAGPMQPIPMTFKSKAQWDSNKLASQEPPTHMWQQGGDLYYNVCLDEKRVKQIWPRKGFMARLRRCSPIERTGDYSAIFAAQDAYYRDTEPALMNAFEQLFGRFTRG